MKPILSPLLLALSATFCLPALIMLAADSRAAATTSNSPTSTQSSSTNPSPGTGSGAVSNARPTGKAATKAPGKSKARDKSKGSSKGSSKDKHNDKAKDRSKTKSAGDSAGKGGKASMARMHRATAHGDPEFANFNQWRAVTEFIDEMSNEHGFDREALRAHFSRTHYIDAVVKLINPPPAGRPKNWTAYRERFVEPQRLQAGVAFWNRHEDALRRAEAEFGVPANIIVGIIGVETFYGRDTGRFRVVDALTTLAFAYPDTPNRDARKDYFRNELRQVLLYARENEVDPFALHGSFAGAIGWPQFMPGSIRKYAVDFDGDGKIDLRNSPIDAIGSVGSFLANHGWLSGLPLVYPVAVSSASDAGWPGLIGQSLEARHTLAQMKEAGVNVALAVPESITYGLVDLQDGNRPTRYWIGTGNFFAITQYNRSFFYAMAVIELGQAVAQQRQRSMQ